MALTRAQLSNFYADRKPYLDEVIGQNYREFPKLYTQFLNVKSVTSGWKDTATVSGFGTFTSKAELEDAASDDILQGPTLRTAMVTFAKRNLISQEAIEDEQGDGIIAARLPEMMFAGRATEEILAHDLINNGHVNTFFTTPDLQPLWSASHVDLSGGTYSNLITTDMGVAGIEQAITAIQGMKNDRGIPIFQVPGKLVIPPTLEWVTAVTLGSAQLPGGTNNDMNPLYNRGLQVIVDPYITDEDGWTLFADQHKLNFIWRVQPENWSEVDYVKSAVQIGMRFRCAVEALDPRGAVHSDGSAT